MKANKSLVAALMLGVAVVTSSTVIGAEKTKTPPKTSQSAPKRLTDQQRVDQMAKRLSLSPEQKDAVAKIYKDRTEQLKTLRAQTTDKKELKQKSTDLQKETNTKIEKLLTPDQLAKWKTAPKKGPARAKGPKKV